MRGNLQLPVQRPKAHHQKCPHLLPYPGLLLKGLMEDGEVCAFLDTGAGLSLISEHIPALKHRPLLKTFQTAHTLTGQQLDILGALAVAVCTKPQFLSTDVHVVRDSRCPRIMSTVTIRSGDPDADQDVESKIFNNRNRSTAWRSEVQKGKVKTLNHKHSRIPKTRKLVN